MRTMKFDFGGEAEEAFSQGDCWVLARELHRLTGWPLKWAGSRHGDQLTSWCHIMVQEPGGNFVDISGVHSPEDFTNYWRRTAKGWGCIKKPRDFKIDDVKDFDNMVIGMRPRYALGSHEALDYAEAIAKAMEDKE